MRFGARSYVRRSAVLPVPRPSRTGYGGEERREKRRALSVAEAAIPRPANQAQERSPKPKKDPPRHTNTLRSKTRSVRGSPTVRRGRRKNKEKIESDPRRSPRPGRSQGRVSSRSGNSAPLFSGLDDSPDSQPKTRVGWVGKCHAGLKPARAQTLLRIRPCGALAIKPILIRKIRPKPRQEAPQRPRGDSSGFAQSRKQFLTPLVRRSARASSPGYAACQERIPSQPYRDPGTISERRGAGLVSPDLSESRDSHAGDRNIPRKLLCGSSGSLLSPPVSYPPHTKMLSAKRRCNQSVALRLSQGSRCRSVPQARDSLRP